jgi:flagellar assembly protein FliH
MPTATAATAATAVPLFGAETAAPHELAQPVLLSDTLPALTGPLHRKSRYRPSDAEAGELLQLAEEQAEQIVANAHAAADRLLITAREDADEIRLEARSLGYTEGAADARAQIQAELEGQYDEQVKTLREGVNWVVASILEERERMWHSVEQELTTLAIEIARKVIKIEVNRGDEVIQAVITDALRRVSDRENVRILVCPDELQQVRARREDLLAALDGIKNLVIDGDRRVGAGGCTIETNAGAVDAKIETQLEQVAQALKS